jgi:hypothetical protein
MEAAVLNENFVGSRSGHNHAGEKNSRDVAFQCLLVASGLAVRALAGDAQRFEKIEIRVLAGEGKDEVIFQPPRSLRRFQQDAVRA